jgi:hypothetical protein
MLLADVLGMILRRRRANPMKPNDNEERGQVRKKERATADGVIIYDAETILRRPEVQKQLQELENIVLNRKPYPAR